MTPAHPPLAALIVGLLIHAISVHLLLAALGLGLRPAHQSTRSHWGLQNHGNPEIRITLGLTKTS